MATAVYWEKTPLATELGIRSANKILAIHALEEYAALLGVLPDDVSIVTKASAGEGAIVHLFVRGMVKIERNLGAARKAMANGALWDPGARSPRRFRPTSRKTWSERDWTNLVDVKVCAVSEIWAGLKFVARKKPR